jgi:GTP-dependent phosphoenolpyruvate carboxykinase
MVQRLCQKLKETSKENVRVRKPKNRARVKTKTKLTTKRSKEKVPTHASP